MGAFVALFHRDGAPVDREGVGRLLAPLAVPNGDGLQVSARTPFGFGHSAFWTVPEDVGEQQPLETANGNLALLFDGRLDNRAELVAALGEDASRLRTASDGTLALHCLERWGEEALGRFLGPFALCLVDVRAQSMLIARDPLGDRALVYHLSRRHFLVASDEAALRRHPAVRADLDDTSVALYFALRPPAAGATLFRDIRELVPGSSMRVGHTHESSSAFWRPPAERSAWRRPDAEYFEEYREILTASVKAALRYPGPPAALMSGGLDSTTVVALASGALKESGSATPMRTISWVFDEIRECDERRWIDVMVRAFGLRSVTFPGDGYWPLRDFSSWPTWPGGPERNPYRMLKGRAYAEAARHGHRVLLIGASGDQIYIRWRDAVASMITQLRAGALAEELWLTWRQWGMRGLRHHRAVRRLGGMLAEGLVPGRSPARSRVPAWLSPAGAALVKAASSAEQASPLEAPTLHPAVSWRTAWSTSRERPNAASLGVELRDPFRDRRVVEFALRLPPHMLLRRTLVKHLVREAMRGILPEEVRLRTANSALLGLYRRGLLDRERSALERLVGSPNAAWRRFVEERLLRESCSEAVLGGKDEVLMLLPFVCASFDRWVSRQGWGVRDERIEGVG